MGLFSFFSARTQKAVSGSPAFLESLAARQVTPYPALGGTNIARNRIGSAYVTTQNASYGWIYRYSPSVRRCVDYIARNVAQLGLKVYERISDDEREHRGDHAGARALRNPNPQTPGQQFIFQIVADFLVYNNAYALKFRTDEDLLLVGIPPHDVGLVGQSRFTVDAYRIWRADGSSFDVAPEDIVHWRGYNPEDPRRGESYLETLREELAADSAARQATTELHRSGLALPGWIERPLDAPEWSETGRARFEQDWAARAKAGKRQTPVLEEGMSFKQGGVTPEDAELLAGRRFTTEQVAGIYGLKNVPPEGEEERKQFYADVLPPLCEMLASFLDLQVLAQEFNADEHYFEFNLDEKRMSDDRIKTLTSAAGAPIMLRDEARAALNLPALPEGIGQEPVTPMNVSLGKPSPQLMPPQDPNGPEQDGSFRSGEADEPSAAGSQRSLNGHHKAVLIPRRVAKMRRHQAYADEFETVLKAFVARVEKRVNGSKSKAIDADRWTTELAEDLLRVARRAVAREGGIEAARLGLDDIDLERTEGWLRRVTSEKATEVVRALGRNLDEGEAKEVFANAKSADSPRAAVGMATTFAAFAVKEAGQQTPDADRRTKTWIVTSGNSQHPEMDGETVYLGETFSNGADGPPADHPGCQCLMEIDGGGFAPAAKAIQPNINITTPDVYVKAEIPEGAFQITNNPPEVNVTTPDVHVSPAEVHIHEGAVKSEVNVEPSPTELQIAEGAIKVDVAPSDVHVEAAEAPNVNVEVKGGKSKRTVTFSDGRTAEIDESNETKRIVTFSDGRKAEINESEEE